MSVFPITFSIPKEKIVDSVPTKTKVLSDLIPGNTKTYIYGNEIDYYNEYQRSYFARTQKKAGWDCMRHYEILANGCIPCFIDIEKCPQNTMALLPKQMFIEANKLYEKYKNFKITDFTDQQKDELNSFILQLLEFTKKNLTTEQIAKYVLEKTNCTNSKKILYISNDVNPDYLRCVTLHGFKKLFGTDCHDHPKIPHIYKNQNIDYSKLYGKGITYTNLLEESEFRKENIDLENSIKNKEYDVVIFGSLHRGLLYYHLVCQHYKPNEIILLCGEDIHKCICNDYVKKGNYVFVRELN